MGASGEMFALYRWKSHSCETRSAISPGLLFQFTYAIQRHVHGLAIAQGRWACSAWFILLLPVKVSTVLKRVSHYPSAGSGMVAFLNNIGQFATDTEW